MFEFLKRVGETCLINSIIQEHECYFFSYDVKSAGGGVGAYIHFTAQINQPPCYMYVV